MYDDQNYWWSLVVHDCLTALNQTDKHLATFRCLRGYITSRQSIVPYAAAASATIYLYPYLY